MFGRVISALGFAGFALAVGVSSACAGALHGTCISPTPSCSDNNSITPVDSNSPNFGWTASPDRGTALFILDVLIPDNVSGANSENFTITGVHTANAKVAGQRFSATAWTSGSLESYLGLSSTPNNPLSAFLTDPHPSTQTFQPSATGYYDYTFAFGDVTFGSTTDPTFSTGFDFPEGTVITAFTDIKSCKNGICTDNFTSTASSSALIIDTPVLVPEPSPVLVLAGGLLGLGYLMRRRAS
jgi:hypothetical protein